MPAELGPPSLTSPIRRLPDGTLVCGIETNKEYEDAGPWMQRVLFIHSTDDSASWGSPITMGQDPTGRLFNWDQRLVMALDAQEPRQIGRVTRRCTETV